jgi:hypothetical protein
MNSVRGMSALWPKTFRVCNSLSKVPFLNLIRTKSRVSGGGPVMSSMTKAEA